MGHDGAPGPGVERFAIHDRGGLGVVRWIGRLLSLAALWPLSYAWIVGPGFDGEALVAGATGLALGLGWWWWAGFRLRNPREYLEIDREAGRARLRRDGHADEILALAELGPWRYEQWTTTSTSQGQRRTVTWHAARSSRFPDQRLFATTDERRLRAWTASVDAAAAGKSATGAAGDASEATTTIAALLAARVDALTWALAGRASLPLGVVTIALAGATWAVLEPTTSEAANPPAAIVVAVIGAALTLGWRAARGPWVGAGIAAVLAAALLAKPWVAPITARFDGAAQPLSPTSETHLYFVIPGVLLAILALILVTTVKVEAPPRRSRAGAGDRRERIELPRPKPPGT